MSDHSHSINYSGHNYGGYNTYPNNIYYPPSHNHQWSWWYYQPQPAKCPGCGRCNTCGHTPDPPKKVDPTVGKPLYQGTLASPKKQK